LLQRRPLYRTPAFHDRYEQDARENLDRALGRLEAG